MTHGKYSVFFDVFARFPARGRVFCMHGHVSERFPALNGVLRVRGQGFDRFPARRRVFRRRGQVFAAIPARNRIFRRRGQEYAPAAAGCHGRRLRGLPRARLKGSRPAPLLADGTIFPPFPANKHASLPRRQPERTQQAI